MKRIMTGVLGLTIAILVLAACSNDQAKEKNDQKDTKKEEYVALINGEGITKSEYETQLNAAKASYEQQGISMEGMDRKKQDQFRMSILDQMVNAELLLQTAEKQGTDIDQKDLDAEMEKIKSGFENEKKYKEALKKNNLTEDKLKSQVKKQLLVTQYIDNKIGKVNAEENEVKKLYDDYKKETESQDQAPKAYEELKPQLEKQVIAQKKEEKTTKLIEDLRKENEENIEIRL